MVLRGGAPKRKANALPKGVEEIATACGGKLSAEAIAKQPIALRKRARQGMVEHLATYNEE